MGLRLQQDRERKGGKVRIPFKKRNHPKHLKKFDQQARKSSLQKSFSTVSVVICSWKGELLIVGFLQKCELLRRKQELQYMVCLNEKQWRGF